MWQRFFAALDNLRGLVGIEKGLRRRLLTTYLELHGARALRKLLGTRAETYGLLGFRVESIDESAFVRLTEEIFVRRAYFFPARRDDPFIIDCGANIGLATLFFKATYPAARVLAFEPDPRLFSIFERNIQRNGLQGVTAVPKTIFHHAGRIQLRPAVYPAGGFWGLARTGDRVALDVEAVDLCDAITEHVDFVKMDIEGVEGKVVRRLGESGKLALIERLVIEYHHNGGHDQNLSDLLIPLEDAGFTYQICAPAVPPYGRGIYQDILVHAWKKPSATEAGPS
jgi:FkbM family methyltransferase